jgi:hypothetical protein
VDSAWLIDYTRGVLLTKLTVARPVNKKILAFFRAEGSQESTGPDLEQA